MLLTRKFITAGLLLGPALCGASITSITSGDTVLGSRPSNLILNGSFEADEGFAPNHAYWATGTTLLPTMSLTSWQASGQVGTYAEWGNDGDGRERGSDFIPHGREALYFGGGIMGTPSVLPTYHADGTVTFASTPVFTPKPTSAPVTLSQTVSGLSIGQNYLLDFWASSEFAGVAPFTADGFFGLDITGESQMYFTCPQGTGALGASQRYYVMFKPTASTETITFTNWGHYSGPGGLSTELVLDDVILNKTETTPEPASMAAIGLAAIGLLRRRRANSK